MIQEKHPGLSADRPFVGLRPFGFADHEYFFGREDQVYSLFRLLDRGRFIAVVGSSGSGKSSLVRAGLLPILEQESAGIGGRQWRWIEMRPGDAPLDNLAREVAKLGREAGPDEDAMAAVREGRIGHALRRSSFGLGKALSEIKSLEGQSVLLVVDQFEELFRFAHAGGDAISNAKWREEAAHFVQTLLEATRERSVAIHVLITMRSDFIGDCAQFYGLPEAVSATQFLVPSTTRDQREQIITTPVAKAGAAIDPILVEQLLNDVSDELDQLPVLQHCLMRLWEAARWCDLTGNPHLSMTHYEAIGRAQGALSKHAEEIFDSLDGREMAVEQMFRAIAEIDGDGRVIRRALPFSRLVAETGIGEKTLRSVCDRFRADDCSFLVPSLSAMPRLTDETPVDVGHEALLRRWGRVGARPTERLDHSDDGGWLVEEERDGRKYRALLALVEGRRGQGRVTLPVSQVEEWMEWWNARPRTPTWAERYGGNFARIQRLLNDSVAALAEENTRAARQTRFDRLFRIAAVAAVLLIVALGVTAFVAYLHAQRTKQMAEQESAMMLDQMTANLYATFENFRLVPHSEAAVKGIWSVTRDFDQHYKAWADGHGHTDASFPRLDTALAIVQANTKLLPGDSSGAVRDLDAIERDKIGANPPDDLATLLLRAEFHFHRATAERYDDLFARSRYDYGQAVALAGEFITRIDKQPSLAEPTARAEADSLARRSLRARVEVDTSAHQISNSQADLDRAAADNQAYGATFAASGKSSGGKADLSNIGARPEEKWIHDGLVEVEQGRATAAVADYEKYIAALEAQVAARKDPFLASVILATGRQGYARALVEAGRLDEAERQLTLADDYYEQELMPGDRFNPFALHSDDQVHWVRGYVYLKRGDLAKARAEFQSMLARSRYLITLDAANVREWDDAYRVHIGLARAADQAGDAAAETSEQADANEARAKADAVRAKSIAKLPAAEQQAILHQ